MSNELQSHVCGECGITWAAPATWWSARRQDAKTFYCPNGHARVFKESEADKLRRERDRLKQNEAWYEQRLAQEREARAAAERRASASRGQVTKLKKRAANGVCPCCNRTFANLARHMATKHTGFVSEEAPESTTLQ